MALTMHKAYRIMPLIALVWALGSCSSDDGETLIFAASSLAAATDDIDAELRAEGSVSPPEWVLAGSSRLIAQVRDGARPDIIVAADVSRLDEILDLGYVVVDEPRIANRLVLAVADGNPARINSIDDLSLGAPLIGLCAPEVPCGATALRVAEEFGLTLRPDTAEPNVRALAHKLAGGELDAGLVYATDAASLGLQTINDARLEGADGCKNPAVTRYGIAALASPSEVGAPSPATTVDRYLLPQVLQQAGFELGRC
ncbi:MAG: substrate-binding domain-containing protein [Acidimicrobiaceae bacterium]|nr:substrate-binding domain-containing protein [Acidimicrobiaceae bacterium]